MIGHDIYLFVREGGVCICVLGQDILGQHASNIYIALFSLYIYST